MAEQQPDSKRKLEEVYQLIKDISDDLEKYRTNPNRKKRIGSTGNKFYLTKNHYRNFIEQQIGELQEKLFSPPINDHIVRLIGGIQEIPHDERVDRFSKDIFSSLHFDKMNRKYHPPIHNRLVDILINEEIQEIGYPEIVNNLIESLYEILTRIDRRRKKAKVKKDEQTKVFNEILVFGMFGIKTIIFNSMVIADFTSSFQVGLASLGFGLTKVPEYWHLGRGAEEAFLNGD